MAPKPMSIGPKRLRGRRRYQYKPATTGPRTKSAFWTASQPGYVRKSADSVTHRAAADAAIAPTRTATCHQGRGRAAVTPPPDTHRAYSQYGCHTKARREAREAGVG